MISFDTTQIAAMEKFYRINLINSLTGFKSVNLVGTVNEENISNLCIVSSVFHLGANPPLIGLVIRPERPNNDTLRNIRSSGEFTLNNVKSDCYMQAHQTSASYPAGESEFRHCGFTEMYTEGFKPPFVQESTVRIGLALREVIDMKLNRTTIIIGEVVKIIADDSVLESDGTVNHASAKTITVAGLDSYYLPVPLGRLAYAKPDQPPHALDSTE